MYSKGVGICKRRPKESPFAVFQVRDPLYLGGGNETSVDVREAQSLGLQNLQIVDFVIVDYRNSRRLSQTTRVDSPCRQLYRSIEIERPHLDLGLTVPCS
jgi:hypothetical protein